LVVAARLLLSSYRLLDDDFVSGHRQGGIEPRFGSYLVSTTRFGVLCHESLLAYGLPALTSFDLF
jgi:hypothetical protein